MDVGVVGGVGDGGGRVLNMGCFDGGAGGGGGEEEKEEEVEVVEVAVAEVAVHDRCCSAALTPEFMVMNRIGLGGFSRII